MGGGVVVGVSQLSWAAKISYMRAGRPRAKTGMREDEKKKEELVTGDATRPSFSGQDVGEGVGGGVS